MVRRITYVVLLLLVSSLTPLSAQVGRLRQAVQTAKKDVATGDRLLGNTASQTAAQQDPKWDNYDFVPGSKVLFFTDFTDDRTGNFSRRLRFKSGAMDVVMDGAYNVGAAPANLTLSEARGAAVKTALVSKYGAGGDRITTKGLGDTKPALPNTTAEGRAQDGRVEVVKQ